MKPNFRLKRKVNAIPRIRQLSTNKLCHCYLDYRHYNYYRQQQNNSVPIPHWWRKAKHESSCAYWNGLPIVDRKNWYNLSLISQTIQKKKIINITSTVNNTMQVSVSINTARLLYTMKDTVHDWKVSVIRTNKPSFPCWSVTSIKEGNFNLH